MATGGRKPKPPRLRVLTGNAGKRSVNKDSPKPKPAKPSAPEWLDKIAKACWRRNVKHLADLGLIGLVDRDMLSTYCHNYSIMVKAAQLTNGSSILIVGKRQGKKGRGSELVKNPAIQIGRDAAQIMARIAAEFGMTPSSRGRMTINPSEEEDEFEAFLNGTQTQSPG